MKPIKLILTSILICTVLCSCTQSKTIQIEETGKPIIVATIFPQYDFLREIAKDKADIYLLIPPGGESHSYEPSPSDIINIKKSDLFVYAGGNVDIWADKMLDSAQIAPSMTIALTDLVTLICEDHDHSHEHNHTHEHSEYDEHVWTSPANAIKICTSLCDKLCTIDKENASFYKENCDSYTKKLKELDVSIRKIVEGAKRKTIVFADRFPIRYFTEEYGIEYIAAFPGCASETEPGPKTLVNLIDRVRQENIPVVFYREFSNQKVADLVCESTNAKKLLFHSCHNLSAEDFESGENYYTIMSKNILNLKEALN